jgi:8-oxo-dGTP diphosphatase
MSTSADATPVGIAVVEHRGRYLVGIRGPGPLEAKAEFPGGKCQPGESAAQAAVRECLEETGLAVSIVDLLMRRKFTYDHGTVELQFWLCRPAPRAEVQDVHQGFRWVPQTELASLDFPEANKPVIDVLVKKYEAPHK